MLILTVIMPVAVTVMVDDQHYLGWTNDTSWFTSLVAPPGSYQKRHLFWRPPRSTIWRIIWRFGSTPCTLNSTSVMPLGPSLGRQVMHTNARHESWALTRPLKICWCQEQCRKHMSHSRTGFCWDTLAHDYRVKQPVIAVNGWLVGYVFPGNPYELLQFEQLGSTGSWSRGPISGSLSLGLVAWVFWVPIPWGFGLQTAVFTG